MTAYAAPAGRVLLSLIFLVAGVNKLAAVEGTQQYMASAGVPEILFWPSTAFEIIAPLALMVGFKARAAALLLAAFSLLTAALFHADLASSTQMTMFLKNVAIAGGLLLVAAHGPGRFALAKS